MPARRAPTARQQTVLSPVLMVVAENQNSPVRREECDEQAVGLLFWIFSQFAEVLRISLKFSKGKPHIFIECADAGGAGLALNLNGASIPLAPGDPVRCVLAVTRSKIYSLAAGRVFNTENVHIRAVPLVMLDQVEQSGLRLDFLWGVCLRPPGILMYTNNQIRPGEMPSTAKVPGRVAFVTGLLPSTNAKILGLLAMKFGYVEIVRLRERQRQHAFVQYARQADCEAALRGGALQQRLRELQGNKQPVVRRSDLDDATHWVGTTLIPDGDTICTADMLPQSQPQGVSTAKCTPPQPPLGAQPGGAPSAPPACLLPIPDLVEFPAGSDDGSEPGAAAAAGGCAYYEDHGAAAGPCGGAAPAAAPRHALEQLPLPCPGVGLLAQGAVSTARPPRSPPQCAAAAAAAAVPPALAALGHPGLASPAASYQDGEPPPLLPASPLGHQSFGTEHDHDPVPAVRSDPAAGAATPPSQSPRLQPAVGAAGGGGRAQQ
eukprot:TRINITY_DN3080_c0_g1_i1.p1 TRINITY_DN3080_c0_g1~~TRINITY_DN3080_c0_g1_i1.p1  ORF type:complete len:517 (+),score=134.48 TRINITY_DN3080_c0_g1_i1:83-1552(+)